jgi:hypothetical protein
MVDVIDEDGAVYTVFYSDLIERSQKFGTATA